MNRFRLIAAAVVAAAFSTAPLSAQRLGPTEQVQLTGVGDRVVSTWDNVYVGPYEGMLVSDPTQPALTLYCVDYAHGVSTGDTWHVNTTGLQSGLDLSNTRLGGEEPVASLVRYRRAAYLASLFSANAGDRSAISGIHAAIWSTMTPGFPGLSGVNNPGRANRVAQPWLAMVDEAESEGFVGMNWAEWRILSDVEADGHVGGKQEYLTRVTATPEPETWLMLATGLLLLGVFYRRRQNLLEDI